MLHMSIGWKKFGEANSLRRNHTRNVDTVYLGWGLLAPLNFSKLLQIRENNIALIIIIIYY